VLKEAHESKGEKSMNSCLSNGSPGETGNRLPSETGEQEHAPASVKLQKMGK